MFNLLLKTTGMGRFGKPDHTLLGTDVTGGNLFLDKPFQIVTALANSSANLVTKVEILANGIDDYLVKNKIITLSKGCASSTSRLIALGKRHDEEFLHAVKEVRCVVEKIGEKCCEFCMDKGCLRDVISSAAEVITNLDEMQNIMGTKHEVPKKVKIYKPTGFPKMLLVLFHLVIVADYACAALSCGQETPLPPTNLRVTDVTTTSVSLKWDWPVDGPKDIKFLIFYWDCVNPITVHNPKNERVDSFTVRRLPSSTKLTFTMKSCTSICSVHSKSVRATTQAVVPPGALEDFSVMFLSQSIVQVKWTEPAYLTRCHYYQVKVISSDVGEPVIFNYSSADEACVFVDQICKGNTPVLKFHARALKFEGGKTMPGEWTSEILLRCQRDDQSSDNLIIAIVFCTSFMAGVCLALFVHNVILKRREEQGNAYKKLENDFGDADEATIKNEEVEYGKVVVSQPERTSHVLGHNPNFYGAD